MFLQTACSSPTPRSLPMACIRCSVYFSGSVKGWK
jgi:hypothetical protein